MKPVAPTPPKKLVYETVAEEVLHQFHTNLDDELPVNELIKVLDEVKEKYDDLDLDNVYVVWEEDTTSYCGCCPPDVDWAGYRLKRTLTKKNDIKEYEEKQYQKQLEEYNKKLDEYNKELKIYEESEEIKKEYRKKVNDEMRKRGIDVSKYGAFKSWL